ncbi:hypothetical protein TNCV_1163701 [Trichonephila clavipes]|nr:hypothetical protein TNCV_1163701 [Trichonephila clavipes]
MSMTSYTLEKSNTRKVSSAKSCLVSRKHSRMLAGEVGSEEQLVHISMLLDPSENFIDLSTSKVSQNFLFLSIITVSQRASRTRTLIPMVFWAGHSKWPYSGLF